MVTKHKSRVNQRYFGCTTELDEALSRAYCRVDEALPDRSKSRLMRLAMWAGLERLGLANPPDSERAEIERLIVIVHKMGKESEYVPTTYWKTNRHAQKKRDA